MMTMGCNSFLCFAFLCLAAFAKDNLPMDSVAGNTVDSVRGSVLHGQCSYTFILPDDAGERTGCRPGSSDPEHQSNNLQGDHPQQGQINQRIHHLEAAVENYTHWLHTVEEYAKGLRTFELAQLQHRDVQNSAAAILDLSTSLFSQMAHYIQRTTAVETQVLKQTSRLKIQMLESSLSNNKLETQLVRQRNEISKIFYMNRALEQRLHELEAHHHQELLSHRAEQAALQSQLSSHQSRIQGLELCLQEASRNSSALQSKQLLLQETVDSLFKLLSKDAAPDLPTPNVLQQADQLRRYGDCLDLLRAGYNRTGVYTIHITMHEPKKVYCDMEAAGGGWTVIQSRRDGTLDFHRTWKQYKMGFGSVFGEHWLGNELVFQLSSQRRYTLRVEVEDWAGQRAFSQYDQVQVASEKHNYRLSLKSHSGTAGRQSSLVVNGADFSTKDMDNDNCICNCALMMTGGWWFDACGPSNLNGIYYTNGQNTGKLNGIKWHYFKGPSYSLHATTMMIRPMDL